MVFLTSFSLSSHAALRTWTGTTGNWYDSANWGVAVPSLTDTAIFNSGTTLLIGVSATIARFKIGDVINSPSRGGIILSAGATFKTTGDALIGSNAYGTAEVVNSNWQSDVVIVGLGDEGLFTMTNSNLTTNALMLGYGFFGGIGTFTMHSGTLNAGLWDIARNGRASVEINSGRIVTGSSNIGLESLGTGTVTMNGGNWYTNSATATLTIGRSGTGTFVMNDGTVNFGIIEIASSTGRGTATINGGTWTATSNLSVGNQGSGTMRIKGGSVLTAYTEVAETATSTSSIIINSGSLISSDGMSVGNLGNGRVDVVDTGYLEIGMSATLRLAHGSTTSSGTLNIGTGIYAGTFKGGEINGGIGKATVNFDHSNSTITFSTPLTGTLSVNKLGGGTSILTGSNSYSGTTTIGRGTLRSENKAALGHSRVLVSGSGVLHVGAGVLLELDSSPVLTVPSAKYRKDFNQNEGFTNFGRITSSGTNTAAFLGGIADETLQVQVSFSATASRSVFNNQDRISNVLKLDGTGDSVFVMQLSYTDAAYQAAVLAGLYTSEDQLRLGYLEGGAWILAADEIFVEGAWNGSLVVGTYGVDVDNNTVWAVLNHNSEYAVIPEPSTYTLLALGLTGLILFRRRASLS